VTPGDFWGWDRPAVWPFAKNGIVPMDINGLFGDYFDHGGYRPFFGGARTYGYNTYLNGWLDDAFTFSQTVAWSAPPGTPVILTFYWLQDVANRDSRWQLRQNTAQVELIVEYLNASSQAIGLDVRVVDWPVASHPANVLNDLPRGKQGKAKGMLHDIWMAETKAEAERALDRFLETYRAKYPKAAACLAKDRDVLLTFYDFPAEHWMHLRTTNPIESTFATVRLRTRRPKGCGSRIATLTMVFRLAQCAEQHWRVLNGSSLLEDVIRGVRFVDGLRTDAA